MGTNMGTRKADEKSATFSCSKPDIKTKRVMNRTGFITLFGTREGIRTPDLLVRSQTLYPTELLAHIAVS